MVTATQGVLITGDVSLIEYIRALDEQLPPAERFIVTPKGGPLDDTHLLVRDSKAAWVQEKVAEWQQSLRFEPKRDQQ